MDKDLEAADARDDAPVEGEKPYWFSMFDGMKHVGSSILAGIGYSTTMTALAARMSVMTMSSWIHLFSNMSEVGMQSMMDVMEQTPAAKAIAHNIDVLFDEWYERQLQRRDGDLKNKPDHWIYDYNKYTMSEEMNFLPPSKRTAAKALVMYGYIGRILEKDGVAGVLREVSKYDRSVGELSTPQYNKKFLNEHSDGTVHETTPEDIVNLFPPGGKDFPRIIITASHARGESLDDMKCITHGIEAMARDASGEPLPIAGMDEKPAPGKTVMLFACDSERTVGLNAAALIDRHRELKRCARTGEPDQYKYICPAAKRMAKLMLKCMLKDPSLIDVEDPRSLQQIYGNDEIPPMLELRPQAARIAQHFQFIGYSKGGNVVSDAIRYLTDEMKSRNLHGQPLVVIRNDKGEELPLTQHHGPLGVKSIIRNIGCISMAAREVGISKEMDESGMRRVSINNRNDRIGFHGHYEDQPHDENWSVEGKTIGHGHTPEDAMGTREGQRGYLLDDPRVERRFKEIMAPHYGKASIDRVSFVADYKTAEGKRMKPFVRIHAAQGTTDELFDQHRDQIIKALLRAKVKNPHLEALGHNSRQFILHGYGNFFRDPAAVKKLQEAFADLRQHAPGLLISQRIIDEDLPRQWQAANENKPSHAERALQSRAAAGQARVA